MKSIKLSKQTLTLTQNQKALDSAIQTLEKQEFVSRLWKEDAHLWKKESEHVKIIKNSLGWLTVAKWIEDKLPELEKFAKEVRKKGFKDVVLLGMGGSSLAAEVFRLNLPSSKGAPRLHVLDSTDPSWVGSIEKSVKNIKKTLFILSSKSGTTVEPLSFYNYFYELTQKNGSQFVAITDPGSYLENVAKQEKFLKTFLNPSNIGGRFSALSYFGLVPAALAGKNVKKMISSALAMMQSGKETDIKNNPAVLLGAAMGALAKAGKDKLTLLMPKETEAFGLWIEQLVAESSGKENLGIVPIAQEALIPAKNYANDRLFVSIQGPQKTDKKIEKLVKKLKDLNHPVIEIETNNAEDLGAEMWRWEVATSSACAILGVNTFDQPDVQSAKSLTKAALEKIKNEKPAKKNADSKKSISFVFSKESQGNLKQFLQSAGAGDYWGILPFLPQEKKLELQLKKLRSTLLDSTQKATLFGYGPRYLHSTGQLHKGGANNGLYIILTADTKKDLPVPQESFSFAQLESAQALGDFQALDAKNRRALHVHLTGNAEKAVKLLIEEVNKALKK